MTDGTPAVNYDKPVPRDPKSSARAAQVRMQNRRREYLQRHPSYFDSLDHELAGKTPGPMWMVQTLMLFVDPVLYERLVKRFQSASERTAEGKAKGYGRTLEASLLRGENTLAGLASAKEATSSLYAGRSNSSVNLTLDNPWDAPANDKQQGLELWRTFLEERFIRGGDEEFEYKKVDGDEELDVWERTGDEERWFEDEEPSWAEGYRKGGREEARKGQTGVQDY